MNAKRIWLIGDDSNLASRLSDVVASHGYQVETKLETWSKKESEHAPAVIVLNVAASGMAGLNALISARKSSPPIPVIVLVAQHQTRIVVEALKLGAADALIAPIDTKDLLVAINLVLQKPQSPESSAERVDRPHRAEADSLTFSSQSPKMAQTWNVAKMVARTDVPVLIMGESGVGKEVLARFIYRNSKRADKPLIKVNCAALPQDLLESELFGYERGAFTGAVGEKPGKFELADKGCMLLDEIGEMPLNLQAKLLHVLEDGEFTRLGGKNPIKVDVRVVALTNRRLEEAVSRGEFRDDLYFRLNVIKITIPPLRERTEDIPLLCENFFRKHREALGCAINQLPPELIDVFMRYSWPGNVRQLENTMKRYLILPDLDMELSLPVAPSAAAEPADRIVEPRTLAAAAAAAAHASRPVIAFPASEDSISLKAVVSKAAEETERQVVLYVLKQTNWNRRLAARRLNICYKGLLNKLKKWQIHGRRAS